ncbi:MAG TPA: anti-sigma factor, partial [Candidatus Limnocylindrales bacterium]
LQRASRLIAATVRELPPPDLRERTLASVRALGRARGPLVADEAAAVGLYGPAAPRLVVAGAPPTAASRPIRMSSGRRAAMGWIAAIAAAIVLSVATTSVLVGSRVDRQLADQSETIQTLQEITTATLRVAGEPDARHVALTGTADSEVVGSLVFSPSTADLVVVATGLSQPPPGQEYRCWVERAGQRQRVGRMFFSGGLAYWIGNVPAVSGLSSDARFGVSLVDASSASLDAPPVLAGGL